MPTAVPTTPVRTNASTASKRLSACPQCGADLPPAADEATTEAQRRIAEFEAQVRLLTDKATTAADKLADYEDELHYLKTSQNHAAGAASASDTAPFSPTKAPLGEDVPSADPATASPTRPTAQPPPRFPSLLTRKPSTTPTPSPAPPPPSQRESDLQAALAREQALRQQAEAKAAQMSGELEELSATLFQQANEMVAAERRARARLEERVEVLERRDAEKRKRLERLEGAVRRIERVRGVLGE